MSTLKSEVLKRRVSLAATARFEYLEDGRVKMYVTTPDWSVVDDDATDAPQREILNYDFDCQAHYEDWLNAADIPDCNLAYAKSN